MPAAPHTRIRIVQSRDNARVKELRAALARPGAGLLGLEGVHLVEEALRSGLTVRTIFVRAGEERLLASLGLPGVQDAEAEPEILSVPAEILRSAVTTEAPQAIAALAVPPVFTPDQLWGALEPRRAPLLLVLAALQDPGNVGTILRSAEAFGATGVITLPGTANLWNPKSLRASMGSAFRLPVVAMPAAAAFATLGEHSVLSLATVAPGHAGARALSTADLGAPTALWIGNEGAGLGPDLIAGCDAAVTIPCPGSVESLNAAIAASVLLYEASRQRSVGRPATLQRVQKAHPSPS